MPPRFERIGSEILYEGKLVTVRKDEFRHDDGDEVTREIVAHQGAVAVVAHDGKRIYLVRQPREAIGEPEFLELPAGKRDVEGEAPLETAKRELIEEVGKAAEHWKLLSRYYSSAGFTDEEVHVFLATGLSDAGGETHENERIDVITRPLAALDSLIDEVHDAKTLIGLLELRRRRG